MTTEEILEGNKLIAEFLGYKYYKKVLIDFSDCGGIYDWTYVYSKVPIEVYEYPEDDQCYFKDDWHRNNYENYIYNPIYSEDWNQLMPVVEKICRLVVGDDVTYVKYANPRTFGMIDEESEEPGKIMVRLNGFGLFKSDTLIEATWLSVVDFIKWYNNQNK